MICNPDVTIPWEVPFYSSTFIWLLLSLQDFRKKSSREKNYRTGKHLKLNCSVNCPVRSRLWNPLTVQHPFPAEFMFTEAQLSITWENSPFRDVGHFVQPQDQHRTTQFPVCVRRFKHLVKLKWFLITSCRIAAFFPSFPFSSYALLVSFFFFDLFGNRLWLGIP